MISQNSTQSTMTAGPTGSAENDNIAGDSIGMTRALQVPKTKEEMLVYLRHFAKDEEVKAALFKVKMGKDWELNKKGLQGVSRQVMANTYAYLKNIKVDDEAINKLNVAGLRIMLWQRLQELMPELCRTCNNTYFFERTEVPMVKCSMCNKGACRECFTTDISQGKSIHYLCYGCTKIVTQNVGENALDPKLHILQKRKVKVNEVIETNEEAEESCVFIQDVEDDDDEEKRNDENEKKEEMSEGESKSDDKTTKCEDGFRLQKKRGFTAKNEKICPYLRKGYCHFSLSGRKPYKGVPQCPFKHPITCTKLLNNGNKGRYGCDGSGCDKFHPKMCPESLNMRQCQRDCRKGFHVRSNGKAMLEKKRQEEKRKEEEERLRKRKEVKTNNRARFRSEKPWTQQNPSRLPPIQPSGNQPSTTTAFLEEVRREVLRCLKEVLPLAAGSLSQAQAQAGSQAYDLAWPRLQMR